MPSRKSSSGSNRPREIVINGPLNMRPGLLVAHPFLGGQVISTIQPMNIGIGLTPVIQPMNKSSSILSNKKNFANDEELYKRGILTRDTKIQDKFLEKYFQEDSKEEYITPRRNLHLVRDELDICLEINKNLKTKLAGYRTRFSCEVPTFNTIEKIIVSDFSDEDLETLTNHQIDALREQNEEIQNILNEFRSIFGV